MYTRNISFKEYEHKEEFSGRVKRTVHHKHGIIIQDVLIKKGDSMTSAFLVAYCKKNDKKLNNDVEYQTTVVEAEDVDSITIY